MEYLNKYNKMKFSDIKNEIKPFDIILFKGSGLISNTITTIQKSFLGNGDWSHVGVIITDDFIPFKNGEKNKFYIWESVITGYCCPGVSNIETNRHHPGVQIRDLEKVIDNYYKNQNNIVAWFKLLKNPIDKKSCETDIEYRERIIKMKIKLAEFYYSNQGALYEFNPFSLFTSIFTCCAFCNIFSCCLCTKNMYFCSELVTQIYQVLDIIDPNLNPETITPVELIDLNHSLFSLPPVIIENNNIIEV